MKAKCGSVTIITIDGPAASGKTSVSRELAKRYGWSWVSTGAFYRGLAYVALQKNLDLRDEAALAELCLSDEWAVRMTEDQTLVYFQGRDVTSEIFKEQTGSAASVISQYPKVRANLLAAQRACAQGQPVLVAEGRDCGTVVFPQAKVKIFLTAHQESRAIRRVKEQGGNVEELKKAQEIRDHQDRSRATAPMQIPVEAFVVDTSSMTLAQVVDYVDSFVRKELEL